MFKYKYFFVYHFADVASYLFAIYLLFFLLLKYEILPIHGSAQRIWGLPVHILVMQTRSEKCYGFIAVCLPVS